MSRSMLSPSNAKLCGTPMSSMLARDAPSPAPSSIAENLDGEPKGTMVRRDIRYSSLRRVRTHLEFVDFLDIRHLVRSENSPRTHNMCMLGATGHGNPYGLLAFAHADIGRLNHRLLPASHAGLTSDQTRYHPRRRLGACVSPVRGPNIVLDGFA